MSVDGFQTVGVSQHNVVAVASGVVACHAHFAVEGRHNGVARVHLHVDTLVHASEGGAVAVVRGHGARGRRHAEAPQVDAEAVGHLARGVRVGTVRNPGTIEKVGVVGLHVTLYGALYGHGIYGTQTAVNGRLSCYQVLSMHRRPHSCQQQAHSGAAQVSQYHGRIIWG